jgi:hypothetical protein
MVRKLMCALAGCAVLALAGCGGDDEAPKPSDEPSQTARRATEDLRGAMTRASQAIDSVRRTSASVERTGQSLQPTVARTGDVIVVLTPEAEPGSTEARLLTAARQQRSFLQFAEDATTADSRRAANSALSRAQAAGRRAAASYERVAVEDAQLAGLVPPVTTFNIGRLRDAVQAVNRRAITRTDSGSGRSSGGTGAGSGGGSATGTRDCGDGLSVNSVTSCPFARSVRDAFEASGGAEVVEAYSPVTGEVYTMTCSRGIPTVCRGGNNAVVTIR